jgi:hypothetical protein
MGKDRSGQGKGSIRAEGQGKGKAGQGGAGKNGDPVGFIETGTQYR